MLEFNFDNFKVKNKNPTKAFEDMSRILFLRDLKEYKYDYSYNANQAGLEIDPIYNHEDGKWYGFQAKFFTTESNTTKYTQIEDSLKKAYRYYSDLDYIYIYTNSELKPHISDEEASKIKNSPRKRIYEKAKEKSVELKWIQKDNILDLVKQKENLDLYSFYFSNSRELDFVNNGIGSENKTFLRSSEYLHLELEEDKKTLEIIDDSSGKIKLLLGPAGTGKSMLMKNIHLELSDRFNEYFINEKIGKRRENKKIYIPMFIKLKEVVSGDLEEIIRSRMLDYQLDYKDSNRKFAYLLDGLDEVAENDLSRMISHIERLSETENTLVIISSRPESGNLLIVRQVLETRQYAIKSLGLTDIEKYFQKKNDSRKIKKLNKLQKTPVIQGVDDIFSVKLLWENINHIDDHTTKIDIIGISIGYWIKNHKKLSQIPLLEPKEQQIFKICTEVAFQMQKNLSISISLEELQAIITGKFRVKEFHDVNIIISSLLDLFFEYSSYSSQMEQLSYRHRRYQEYFLYQKVREIFFEKPSVLRDLSLLSNKDFVINVFLRTSLANAYKKKDLFEYSALRLFECYLGNHYLAGFTDNLIGHDYMFGLTDPVYTYSIDFIYLLSTYSKEDLFGLLDDKNLNIGDTLTEENFWKLIELHNRYNDTDIAKDISEKYNISTKKIQGKDIYSYLYYLYKNKNYSIEEIKGHLTIQNEGFLKVTKNNIGSNISNESNLMLENAFIQLILEFEIAYLSNLINEANNALLEVISYWLLKFKHIHLLVGEQFEEWRMHFIEKVDNNRENETEYFIHTIVLYNFISEKQMGVEKMSAELSKNNISHYWTWNHDIELNIYLSYILKEDKFKLKEFELGINILKIFMDKKNTQREILNAWIEEIKKYNYIYQNPLNYSHSRIIGQIIANYNFDPMLLKKFFRDISEYESVIFFETLLSTIFKNNKELFRLVINKPMLDYVMKNIIYKEDQFDSVSQSLYSLATMYASFDVKKRHELLIKGINNDILRPAYRNEEFFDTMLVEAWDIAYGNYWIDKFELEENLSLLYSHIKALSITSDNAFDLSHLKFVVEKYNLSSKFLGEEGYYGAGLSDYKQNVQVDDSVAEVVTLENLNQYYKNAENYFTWKSLIKEEYDQSGSLDILFTVFKEVRYPSMYGFGYPIYESLHIPTAILLMKHQTRDQMLNFIFENPGRSGVLLMIKVSALLGNDKMGIKHLNFLMKFGEALLYSNIIDVREDRKLTYADIIQSNHHDWIFKDSENYAYLKSNHQVELRWNNDDMRPFNDEWATNHPDTSAFIYTYKLYESNNLIKEFNLVSVDGSRALLPIPKLGTNIVRRDEYLLSRILNNSIKVLNDYMRHSGLMVE